MIRLWVLNIYFPFYLCVKGVWQFPSELDRDWCFWCLYPVPRVLEVACTISYWVGWQTLRPCVTYTAAENGRG